MAPAGFGTGFGLSRLGRRAWHSAATFGAAICDRRPAQRRAPRSCRGDRVPRVSLPCQVHLDVTFVSDWLTRATSSVEELRAWWEEDANPIQLAHFWLSELGDDKRAQLLEMECVAGVPRPIDRRCLLVAPRCRLDLSDRARSPIAADAAAAARFARLMSLVVRRYGLLLEEIKLAFRAGIDGKRVSEGDIAKLMRAVLREYPSQFGGGDGTDVRECALAPSGILLTVPFAVVPLVARPACA